MVPPTPSWIAECQPQLLERRQVCPSLTEPHVPACPIGNATTNAPSSVQQQSRWADGGCRPRGPLTIQPFFFSFFFLLPPFFISFFCFSVYALILLQNPAPQRRHGRKKCQPSLSSSSIRSASSGVKSAYDFLVAVPLLHILR